MGGRKAGDRQGQASCSWYLGFTSRVTNGFCPGSSCHLATEGKGGHSTHGPPHGPASNEAGGSQVQNRKGGGSAHSPMQTGDRQPEEAADTLSLHDFNILKSSWRGYQEQDCICLPCSLSLKMSALQPLLAFCKGSGGGGGGFLNSNSNLTITDFSILGYFVCFS